MVKLKGENKHLTISNKNLTNKVNMVVKKLKNKVSL